MNKPGYARRKKRDCSANPVLRKQTLRLLLLFRVRTATELFVPESALSATSGHIAYMRQISDVTIIIPDGWTNKINVFTKNRTRHSRITTTGMSPSFASNISSMMLMRRALAYDEFGTLIKQIKL